MFVTFYAIGAPGSPLFKKEAGFLLFYLLPNFKNPVLLHRSSMRTTFSTDNDPIDACQIKLSKIFHQRLTRKEFN